MKLRFLVIILSAVLMVFGIVQLREAPVDVFPEFNPPLVEIQTEALGLSAAEVESLLTVPMEADLLNGVAWLKQIYSRSVAGLSSILLIFEPGTDPIAARQMVQERLTQTFALPNVSQLPMMLQPLSTSSRVMMVGLSSTDLSLIDMSVVARWNIKPRLMGVPGVANVAIWGQREQQLQVLVDPARLQENGVTLSQVIATAGESLWVSPLSYLESSTPGTAGWIDTPNQRLSIRHVLPISSPEELAQVPVVDNDELLLGDVADIVEDHQPLIGDAVLNDGPGLLLVIEKFPGANTLEVTRGVEAALDALRPGLTGIEIDSTVFRPANYIEDVFGNLSSAMVIGAVLVVLVLAAFFFGWRTALISLVVIPLSLVAAAFVLYLRGATFNIMIFAGLVIALGVIVDDAIVDTHNIARRLRQHRNNGGSLSPETIILEASVEMRSGIFFATLIVLLAVLPVFFLENLTGAFFQPLAISYVLAVITSMVVALVVTPALSVILLANAPNDRHESPLIRGLQRLYTGILAPVVRAPYLALGVVVITVLAGLAVVPSLRQELMPSLKQRELLIRWDSAPGTSRPEMTRLATRVSAELKSIEGVRNVVSQVGRAITGDQVVGINSGELWVSLDPAANYDTTVAAVRQVIGGYPGMFREVNNYQPERIEEALTGVDHDLTVRVYGPELPILRDKAQEISQILSETPGVIDVQADAQVEEPQVEIEVDLAKAESFGIIPGDVRRAAATLLSGLRVGNLYEEQKVFDVVVWSVPELRNSLTDVRELLIDLPGGGQVRLGDVADVRIVPTPISIRRDAVSRFADVSANVSGRDLAAVVADVKSRLQGVEFPLEFHAEVVGASLEQQGTQQRIVGFVVIAVIGIFLLLQASFDSWRLAIVAILTLPMALAGGVLATYLSGGVLSLGSLFGFFTVLGLAVRNGILMTRHFQILARDEGEALGPELVLRGARARMAPILMTALATALALVPLATPGIVAGNEIVRGIVTVILGGLITTTILDLFILPTLYLRFGPAALPAVPDTPVSGQPSLEMAH